MPVTFELQGLDAAVFRLKAAFGPKTSERTIEAMRNGMVELAEAVKYQAKGRGGLTRWPAHKPHTWTSSKPGTPPARISGDLLNSVEIKRNQQSRRLNSVWIRVGSDLSYARVQEYGGVSSFDEAKSVYNKGPKRIPERPFMRPAYNRVMGGKSGAAARIVKENVRRELDISFHRA
jgi:phage gpG-like protein